MYRREMISTRAGFVVLANRLMREEAVRHKNGALILGISYAQLLRGDACYVKQSTHDGIELMSVCSATDGVRLTVDDLAPDTLETYRNLESLATVKELQARQAESGRPLSEIIQDLAAAEALEQLVVPTPIADEDITALQLVLAKIVPAKAAANMLSRDEMVADGCSSVDITLMLLHSALDYLQYGT